MKVGRIRSMKTRLNTDSRRIDMTIPAVTAAREVAEEIVG
jgi:hypothetical protein